MRAKAKTMTKEQLIAQKAKLEEQVRLMGDEIHRRREAADLRDPVEGGMAFGALAQHIVAGLPLREFALKATIGFIYGYTLGAVGSWGVAAISLLSMPAWISFVLSVLVATCMIYIAFTTVFPVTTFTYNGIARVAGFIKRESLAARDWVEKTAHDVRTQQAEREQARATVQ